MFETNVEQKHTEQNAQKHTLICTFVGHILQKAGFRIEYAPLLDYCTTSQLKVIGITAFPI